MKLILAAILCTVWLFGGGFVVRKIDEMWRRRPQRIHGGASGGFDQIISKLYVDATQLQDRPYVERSENPNDPH